MFDRTQLLEIISGKRRGLVANAARIILGFLTPGYRVVVSMRNRRFDQAVTSHDETLIKRAGVPVISVGNLTTGGTGKTPVVIWISNWLRQKKLRVAVISRGYGAKPGANNNDVRNDEALEMEHRLPDVPHLQSPDRHKMAQIASEELETEIIVLDDAFQHRRIHRDLDLVLIDATLPFGYGRLLPRGLLREPLSSLRRADLVILTRSNMVDDSAREKTIAQIQKFTNDIPIAQIQTVPSSLLQYDGQQKSIVELKDKPVFCFCGIGNPDNFSLLLNQLGYDVQDSKTFADHHQFSRTELAQIGELANTSGAKAIVCTHKDLVKVGTNRIGGLPVYAVVIDIEFLSGQTEIEHLLDHAMSQN